MSALEKIMLPADAIRYLRGRRAKGRATFFISVGQYAPIEGTDKVFSICGHVEVSLRVAEKFITNAYSDALVARGARISIRYFEDSPCVFVGMSA